MVFYFIKFGIGKNRYIENMKNKLFELRHNKFSSYYKCWYYNSTDNNFIFHWWFYRSRYIFDIHFGIKLVKIDNEK